MAAISAYVQQGSIAAPAGMSNGQISNSLIALALGTNSTTLNTIATSASDAVQGQSLINAVSGAWNGGNRLGANLTGAANMIGMTNPMLGYAQSAQLASQLYNPQTSLAMTMSGYGVTPLTMGKPGSASFTSLLGGIMNRWSGGQNVSSATLNQWLSPNGVGSQMLSSLGLNNPSMISSMKAYGALHNAGYSNQGITNIENAARSKNQQALGILSKYHINANSVLQDQKNQAAIQSQRQGEEEPGFNAGLTDATGLLNKFNQALNGILDGPLGRLVGYAGGFGGMVSNIGGGAATPNGSTAGGSTSSSPGSGISGSAVKAVSSAKMELGVPYVWGGEQPGVGFDCSGLVQWAYQQAGVKLPRTSQQRWAALKNKSVPLGSVREGDLIFQAGSDGTSGAPGHVAIMASNNMLIQAPMTGSDVSYARYDPSQWQHAARPSGSGSFSSGSGGSTSSTGLASASGAMGGYVEGGSMGSTDEISALSGAMSGMAGNGLLGGTTSYGSGSNNASASTGGGNGTAPATNAVAALAKKMAAAKGWTGGLWNDLNAVEMREAGWNLKARNPSSGASGIAQFINGPSEYYQYGGDPNTAAGQVTGFLNYVQQRYKGPAGAWAHEQQYNWYARGTSNAAPGYAVVGDAGPELVKFSGGEKVVPSSMTSGLLNSGGRTAGGGLAINVNVESGAIQVGGNGSLGSSDVSSSGREIGTQIGQYIAQNARIQKIAAGMSH